MYRIINSKIWEDDWFFDLNGEQKLVFIYLITSSHTDQLGVFKANLKYISIETGLKNIEAILKSLYPKVVYIPELKLVFIKNFLKYQNVGGKFEKHIYDKFCEYDEKVKAILIKESDSLRAIVEKFDKDTIQRLTCVEIEVKDENSIYEQNIGNISVNDGASMGDRWGIDGGSMGHHNNINIISESEIYNISESETESENISETESENLEGNIKTTIVGQNDQPQKVKNKGKDNSNGNTKKKYPPEVKVFYEKFKAFREEYLRVPITQRDWHIRAYSVINKLLKKYSLAELEQALEDLQTPVWEDKAPKILELWHFEDWLTKWKVWKNGNIVAKRVKSEDELIEEEVERVLRWAYPNLEDYEFEGNKRVLLAYRKEHGTYPFDVPEEILKGGEKNGVSR